MNWFLRLLRWLLRLLGIVNENPRSPDLALEIDMARATLTWTLPTQRVDGRELTLGELRETRIEMSSDGGANFVEAAVVPASEPQQQFIVDNLVAGDYIFRATVFDTDGRNSAPADVTGTVLGNPNPVADLTVTIT